MGVPVVVEPGMDPRYVTPPDLSSTVRSIARSEWFERAARVGYVAKGVVFVIVGVLAFRVVRGDRGENADMTGALEMLGEQPLSSVLLLALALGLAAYALWRFTQAVADVDDEGGGPAGVASRVAYFWIGLSYGTFAALSIAVLAGWRREGGDGVQEITGTVLQQPVGPWLVGIAGGVVAAAGLRELWVGISGRFTDEFAREQMNAVERAIARWIGWYGHAARGAIFVLTGIFAIRAALEVDPSEARGLSETFLELADQPYGGALLSAVAAGFVAFGIYCGLLALHRHIPNHRIGDDR